MKTMQDYTIYCTEEQTRRAFELGAPIEMTDDGMQDNLCAITMKPDDKHRTYWQTWLRIPTTQQMKGWLREKGVAIYVFLFTDDDLGELFQFVTRVLINGTWSDYGDCGVYDTFYGAECAGITSALDYVDGILNLK